MKKALSLFLALVMALSCFAAGAFATDYEAAEAVPYAYGYVTPATLNVRSGPGTGYERIGGLNCNDQIFILGKENSGTEDWYKINYRGVFGYVMASNIFYRDEYYVLSFCTYSDDEVPYLLSPSSLPAASPTKTGYTFLGWSSVKGSQTVDYLPMDSINMTDNMMLYAVWQAPLFPAASVQKVTYKSAVSAYVSVDNVPYNCRLLINGELSEPQEAGCGHLGMALSFGTLQEDADICIAVTDSQGTPIEGLAHTVTLDVDNSFFGKIKAFFGYVFSGFRWPAVQYVFE